MIVWFAAAIFSIYCLILAASAVVGGRERDGAP
jgi:hypothetical protein